MAEGGREDSVRHGSQDKRKRHLARRKQPQTRKGRHIVTSPYNKLHIGEAGEESSRRLLERTKAPHLPYSEVGEGESKKKEKAMQ